MRHTSRPPRRLVLLGAFVLACVAAAVWPDGRHAERGASTASAPTMISVAVAADAAPGTPPAAPGTGTPPAPPAPDAQAPAQGRDGVNAEVEIGEKGVVVRRHGGGKSAEVKIGAHEFESFDAFVEKAPWLAGLVFMSVALVFVVPLLVIVLVIWYKMRRARMLNETMVKLAERGVVPPPEAMQALGTGHAVPPLPPTPPGAPLYEQAKAMRRQAAWSDLRKGIVMTAIGLAFAFYSMLEDGSPNWVGLVLLFLGIGYIVLWYFEDRRMSEPRPPAPPPGQGG